LSLIVLITKVDKARASMRLHYFSHLLLLLLAPIISNSADAAAATAPVSRTIVDNLTPVLIWHMQQANTSRCPTCGWEYSDESQPLYHCNLGADSTSLQNAVCWCFQIAVLCAMPCRFIAGVARYQASLSYEAPMGVDQ
jgi:hypothetical protein